MMMDLNLVLTFSEAADKWGFRDGNTLRKAVERNRFQEDEIRKSGNVWLTTYDAMYRVFGEPQSLHYHIYYAEIVEISARCIKEKLDFMEEVQDIYNMALHHLHQQHSVALVESKQHPHMIARMFTTQEDMDVWFHYFAKRISKE